MANEQRVEQKHNRYFDEEFTMRVKSMWLYSFLLLMLPAMSFAGGSTCANATGLIPDGRVLSLDFVQPGTSAQPATVWYSFNVSAGHSYSVEVRDDLDGNPSGDLTFAFYSGSCASQMTANSGPSYTANQYRDTTAIEPALIPNTGIRVSVPNPNNDTIAIQVSNRSTATGHYVSVSVSETTQFGPLWTTGVIGSATYNMGYFFQNTTGQTINGTLTLYKAPGESAPATVSSSITVPPAPPITQIYATQMTGTNQFGSAVFTHDGPPAAVLVDCLMVNGGSGDYVMHKFEPARQGSH